MFAQQDAKQPAQITDWQLELPGSPVTAQPSPHPAPDRR